MLTRHPCSCAYDPGFLTVREPYRDMFADRTSSARPSLLSKKQPRGCWTLPGPLFSDSSDSGAALGLKSQMPGLSLISSDRAKLDVMVSESTELFSWPDESRFNTNSPEDLLGGGFSGNGDFADYRRGHLREVCGVVACDRRSNSLISARGRARARPAADQPTLIALGTTIGVMRASLTGEVKQSFHFLVRSSRNRASRMSEARPAPVLACTSCSHVRYCSGYSFRRQSGQTQCENFACECVCR